MRTIIALLLLIQALIPVASYGGAMSLFGEIGGTFSLKGGSRVLDDRGGVLRLGAVSSSLPLMVGVMARGAHVEATEGDAYGVGNVGIFGGLALFQESPIRLRLFLPLSFGKIEPANGAPGLADGSVWFFEPEAQVSYRFFDALSFGFGLNRRYVFSYEGKPGQNDFIEKLMFTGAFGYEIPF